MTVSLPDIYGDYRDIASRINVTPIEVLTQPRKPDSPVLIAGRATPQQRQLGYRCLVALLAVFLLCAARAYGSVSLLMEEPFGTFGAFNPTGHAALYLSGVCADDPTKLRLCRPGELGVVISRYHHVNGYDWLAIPLIPYLYAVDDLADVPEFATPQLESELRDSYRREHLLDIAPDFQGGVAPDGEWIQLVGSSYDRKIYGFGLATTRDQDAMLVAKLNDSRNRGHFNLFFSNCADFSRSILKMLYPNSVPRNSLADFWLTTPKHLARSVQHIGVHHPELAYRAFLIPQVPGSIERSHHVNGIAETLVRSKKYLVPLVFVSPTTAASLLAAYIGTGQFRPPSDAPSMPELTLNSDPDISLDEGIAVDSSIKEPLAGLACTSPKEPVAILEPAGLQIARRGGL